MRHQSSFHEISMNEKLIMNALIKVASVLQFHGKQYRYSKRNASTLAHNEVKAERVEPCIDAQSSCFGIHELKHPPIVCSLNLDHYRSSILLTFANLSKYPPSHWIFEVNLCSYGAVSSILGNFIIEKFSNPSVSIMEEGVGVGGLRESLN